ncbi:aminoglycoside phosphotransferase family protein [Streptomyces sp. NBC_00160]|uniref:phosphotransferase family protein n=1 Tax=Streptomyces sp. NBC_00160 TaxID=2903628 RepID=UPI00224F26EA|nr:phosphotransferase [Streptomyces sp. NBC_00160]MCX5302802.1 aminoglycoside phosphotransferase family protein [Streptomyces sp. NBC_00160]
MTSSDGIVGGYSESELQRVLEAACAAAGLDGRDAELLRGHTNAVVRLRHEPVVVKIARRGTRGSDVERTVRFVRWLMELGFPTAPLHPLPVEQPLVVDGVAVTFWTYLPQPAEPVAAEQLAEPLAALHALPLPDLGLPPHDNVAAIRRSLASITALAPEDLAFLSDQLDSLEQELKEITFEREEVLVQGDPQHRNALHACDGAVLCDWDTIAIGHREWDQVTVEVHCRRFGYGPDHFARFADVYGSDIRGWHGYQTLARIRELRMVTTNARKVGHAPWSLPEVQRRVQGMRQGDAELSWRIL